MSSERNPATRSSVIAIVCFSMIAGIGALILIIAAEDSFAKRGELEKLRERVNEMEARLKKLEDRK